MKTPAQTIAEFVVVPSAVPLTTCSTWLALVNAAYRRDSNSSPIAWIAAVTDAAR
jgi:hypothetical protein